MNINEMDEFVEYSKEKFKRDVEKWSGDTNIRIRIGEDWGENSFWSFFIKGTDCQINEGVVSIIENKFSLDLFDEDYKVYVSKDEVDGYWKGIFEYPIYWIRIKDNNKLNITIEVL